MKPKKSKTKKSAKTKKTGGKRLSMTFGGSRKKALSASSSEDEPVHVVKKRRLYNPESLLAAYKAVQTSTISVNAAAKQFGVPLTTLRDRVDGRISMETTRTGPPLLMSKEEEAQIVHFLQTMMRYGYRYTRLELAEIATDQAVCNGKRKPTDNALTTKWVDNFISRWPCVKELSCKFKGKVDPELTVRTYFDEIKKIIDKFKLLEKGNRIFNIMEIPLTTDHASVNPSYKTGHQFKTENVTSTTVIACGSVSGLVMAPFFIFQASRLRPEMMSRVPPNVNAAISDTGACSPQIFRRYLNEHFLPQTQRFDNEPILVLLDGSKSHMFVGLSDWGKANNVIFSFIPALTTHYLQPLQWECSENMVNRYASICKRHAKSLAGPGISRNIVGELACQAYYKSFIRLSLLQSFKKAGIYPDVSSEESGEEAEDSISTGQRSDDSNHEARLSLSSDQGLLAKEEIVFTEDLVVGQNQEVTDEELVASSEVVLSSDGHPQEVVVTADGQFVFTQGGDTFLPVVPREGHFVIHDGNIFVSNSSPGLQSVQLSSSLHDGDELMDQPSLLAGSSVGSQSLLFGSDPGQASTSSSSARTSKKFLVEKPSGARTQPLLDLIRKSRPGRQGYGKWHRARSPLSDSAREDFNWSLK